jgi:L-amino acid N-acyltransferase YncA
MCTLARIDTDSGNLTPASIVFLTTRWAYLNTPMDASDCVSLTKSTTLSSIYRIRVLNQNIFIETDKYFGMESTIRLVNTEDAEEIQTIYVPHIRDSAVSFEFDPPTTEEMIHRIEEDHPHLPWLVCESDAILGYAYAGPHRGRDAYQWSVDSSVYVREEYQRNGIARGLYTSLFEILRLQGFYNVYAGATLPNPASVGFHESIGFEPIGVYESVGFKDGDWHDVRWWHKLLDEYPASPAPPMTVQEAQQREGWDDAITTGIPSIHC